MYFVAAMGHSSAINPLHDVSEGSQPMPRLIIVLFALALSSCASSGQRLVDLERCADTVPSTADENGKGRVMESCMRSKGYWVWF